MDGWAFLGGAYIDILGWLVVAAADPVFVKVLVPHRERLCYRVGFRLVEECCEGIQMVDGC